MCEDQIQEAMSKYGIPEGYPDFLLILPMWYVARADGKFSFMELFKIVMKSAKSGLFLIKDSEEKEAFTIFAESSVEGFLKKEHLHDFVLLSTAINARIGQYPSDKQPKIRNNIKLMCESVAEASGPLFADHVSQEEREMLDQIFGLLEIEETKDAKIFDMRK